MGCHRARELIHPFIDGELDERRSGDLCRHLDDCAACKLTYTNHLTLRSGLQDKSLYYRSTNALRKRVRASLRQSLLHTLNAVGAGLF